MAKRSCKGTTKAGKPCKANPLKDSDVCMAHADAETRESAGFVAANGKGGRKKLPTAADVLRERFEAEQDEWLQVLTDARNAERALVVGNGPTAHVELVPDHDVRLKAYREINDRIFGRPKQATEISGPDGAPIQTEQPIPDDADWHARVAGVIREAESATAVSANGHVNGNGNGHA